MLGRQSTNVLQPFPTSLVASTEYMRKVTERRKELFWLTVWGCGLSRQGLWQPGLEAA